MLKYFYLCDYYLIRGNPKAFKIYPFVKNEFSLNGVSISELTGYKMNDIKKDFPCGIRAKNFKTTAD